MFLTKEDEEALSLGAINKHPKRPSCGTWPKRSTTDSGASSSATSGAPGPKQDTDQDATPDDRQDGETAKEEEENGNYAHLIPFDLAPMLNRLENPNVFYGLCEKAGTEKEEDLLLDCYNSHNDGPGYHYGCLYSEHQLSLSLVSQVQS